MNSIERAARAGNLGAACREALADALSAFAVVEAVYVLYRSDESPDTQAALHAVMEEAQARFGQIREAVQRALLMPVNENGMARPGSTVDEATLARLGGAWTDEETAAAFDLACVDHLLAARPAVSPS